MDPAVYQPFSLLSCVAPPSSTQWCHAGKLGTRVLLTLTAVAGAVLGSSSSHVKQQYITWLWSLLLSSAGKALVQIDPSDVEDVKELCLAEVHSGHSVALWRVAIRHQFA